ncbi:MAG: hypothetical protein AABW46_02690, partial [Nanoarchaeota archaeon]
IQPTPLKMAKSSGKGSYTGRSSSATYSGKSSSYSPSSKNPYLPNPVALNPTSLYIPQASALNNPQDSKSIDQANKYPTTLSTNYDQRRTMPTFSQNTQNPPPYQIERLEDLLKKFPKCPKCRREMCTCLRINNY